MQVTFCPLMCLGIATDRCVLNELQLSGPTELAIEQQFDDGGCLSLARTSTLYFITLQLPFSSYELDHYQSMSYEQDVDVSWCKEARSIELINACKMSLPCTALSL